MQPGSQQGAMDPGSQQGAMELGSQLELYSKGAIKEREPANREPTIQQRDGKLCQGAPRGKEPARLRELLRS